MLRRIASIALLSIAGLWAQAPQASISGTVKDTQGAIMPGVSVSAVNTDTGVKTNSRTNDAGFYSLQALPIGPYNVTVEQAGFDMHIQKGIVLTTGQTLELNIVLKVGSVSDQIAVTAESPLIETLSSGQSQLIEAKTIEDIPLGDRHSMNVMEIQGAAVFVSYASGQKPYFSVAGGRGRSQNFLMDGGNAQSIRLGQAQVEVDPSIETLQEMKVMSNAFSAEYGGSAGGIVAMTTKSGGNLHHGSLFEYFRNDKMDAANFFSPWVDGEKQRAPIRYNVFGGTTGGPIRRNKVFYFVGYEASRRRDGYTSVLTVPSVLERAGDFSQSYNANGTLAVIYDPNVGTPSTRPAFAGNKIPVSRLDPVALNVIKTYPLPNRAPDNIAGSNNFAANSVTALDTDNVTGKLDYNLSDSQKLVGRFLWNQQNSVTRSVYADPGADPNTSNAPTGWNLLGSWTSIVRPTLVNEFRADWVTRSTIIESQSVGLHYPTRLGLVGIPDTSFPRFNVNGYAALGTNNQYRNQSPIQQTELSDTITWIKGTHSVRFGGDFRRSRNQDDRQQLASGAFTFNKAITALTGKNNTGNGAAALLLGSPSNFQASSPPIIDRRSWYLSGFIQDDWKARRDLTINIGLRWEADTPFKTRNDILNSFDPNAINPVSGTPGVVKFAGVNGFPRSPHDMDLNNFGPRVGFAWTPFGSQKTVVRSAFGIFFAAPYDGGDATSSTALGYGTSLVIPTGENGTTIPFRLSQPIPVQVVQNSLNDSYGAVPLGTTPTTAVTFYQRNRATGYSMQMNFTVQRQVTGSMMVEGGYIGNLSRKLPGDPYSIDQVPTALLTPGNNQSLRPFPQFSDVQIQGPPIGIANYHAFIARAEKRFSHGLNLLATYTYAKALGNTTSIQGLGNEVNEYSNAYNRRADYGPTENDIRHRITWASIYQLPYGRGRRFGSHNLAGAILGDWSVSSVVIWQTAPPFTVTTAQNTTQAFSAGPLRADVLRNPNLPADQRSLTQWFDTSAFAQPSVNKFGNQGVDILRAAGRFTINSSLIREIPVRERVRLQLRGEAFNLFNHANFGLPGQTFGNADFGVINSASAPRQLQLGVRCLF